jgi:alpha-beta hydrolase superfamily lysophospholipase
VRHRELQLAGCQDIALFAQAWLPDRDPRAVVVISHGLGEHGGRYPEVAARLVASDYAVYALDHRGHGRSGGQRANIDRFTYLVSDFGTFAGRAQRAAEWLGETVLRRALPIPNMERLRQTARR